MTQRFRRLLLALGVLAILAGAAALMSSRWAHRWLEQRVVERLENLTGGRVELEALRIQPLIFQVTLRRLVLHGRRQPGEAALFSARTIVLRVHPMSLLQRKLILRSLDWDEAEVHLYRRADGSTNLPEPQAPASPEAVLEDLVELSIGRMTLGETQFHWNEQGVPLAVAAEEVAILLRFDRSRRYTGSISSVATVVKSGGWSLPPTDLTARVEFSSREISATSVVLRCAGLQGHGEVHLRNLASPEAEAVFHVEGESSEFARSIGFPGLHAGTAMWEGKLGYREGELKANGRVQLRQLAIVSPQLRLARADLSADYSVEEHRVVLSNLSISALGGSIQGTGQVSFAASKPAFGMTTQIRGIDLAAVLHSVSASRPQLARFRLASRVKGTAEAKWSGEFENLESRFSLQFDPATEYGPASYPLGGSLRGSVTRARGLAVQIREANLSTRQSNLMAEGVLGVDRGSLAVQFSTSNFEEWRAVVESTISASEPLPLTLRSPLRFSGAIQGPIRQPEIHGHVEVGPFDFHDWKWDSLRANLRATPEILVVDSGQLQRENSTISASGAVSLEDWRIARDQPARLSLSLRETPLEGLRGALGRQESFGGIATANLNLAGPLSALAGTGYLRVEDGAFEGEPFDSLAASLRISDGTWMLENVELKKGQGRLTGLAHVNPQQRFFSAELQGTDFAVADVKRLDLPRRADGSVPIEGKISFTLSGKGTPEDIRLAANWSLPGLQVGGTPVGDFRGSIGWVARRVQLRGEGQGPGGSLRFSGEVHTGGDWNLELNGQYAAFRTGPWIRLALAEKFEGRVVSSGTFNIRGPLKQPRRIEVRGQTQELEVSFPGISWKNENPVELRFANRTLSASRFRMRGPSTDLEVEGSIVFGESAALSVVAQGTADARLLSLLDPALQATGDSEMKVRVGGSVAQPLLNGVMVVRDVNVRYGDLPFRVTGLRGEIALEGERATVRSLRGTSGGGAVALSGFMTLAGTPRFDGQVELDGVRVQYPADFTSVLDGSLHVTGTPDRGLITGELAVRQLFTSESLSLLARVEEVAAASDVEQPLVDSPYARRVRLNILVRSVPAVRLETRDLRLVADVDLRLQGTLAQPVEVGTIHLLSGEGLFRGNRYRIVRGDISMTNPHRTQRLLNLEARTRVQRYELTLDLSGPPERMRIAYRSDPPLPTADILSLLAFGYSRQQEEMSTAGTQALPTVGTSALLSEALSSQVSGRIQRLFGVSRIRVDPNIGGLSAATGGARVTVEQQVTRDFTLTYVTTTASTSQQRLIQFEWILSDRMSLLGVRDHNGILGLELKFRQRFK